MLACRLRSIAWCLVTIHISSSAVAAPAGFESCEKPTSAERSYDDLLCFYLVGAREGRLVEARATLRDLGGGEPDQPWATLVLAHATVAHDDAQAILLYKSAADGFARSGAAEGEVLARRNLRDIYYRRGDPQAAKVEVVRALALA